MFSRLAFFLLAALTSISGVISTPIAYDDSRALSVRSSSHSFDNWGGHSSLNNFDNFYGSDNFDGSHNSQVIVEQSEQLVCHSESIEIIQQRLAVIQEMAKRIITEQICEVETQTIVFEQFHSSMGSFSNDLRRRSGHQVGYDTHIASHFGDLISSDGSISTNDLGFQGHDVGSQTVVVQGNNWNGGRARSSVESAFSAARVARS